MPNLLVAGRCSACGRPAESGLSGAWWHTEQSCHPTYPLVTPRFIPEGIIDA